MATGILLFLTLAGEGFMLFALFHFVRDSRRRRPSRAPLFPGKGTNVIRITEARAGTRDARPHQRVS
jgi:hypothetical protein